MTFNVVENSEHILNNKLKSFNLTWNGLTLDHTVIIIVIRRFRWVISVLTLWDYLYSILYDFK